MCGSARTKESYGSVRESSILVRRLQTQTSDFRVVVARRNNCRTAGREYSLYTGGVSSSSFGPIYQSQTKLAVLLSGSSE